MDEVTRDIQGEIPWCMLFVDDVVLVDESRAGVNRKLELWRRTLEVPQKLKGKFYRTTIRPAMLYGAECWPTKRRHVQQLSVAEMRMLRWFCGHTRRDRVRNEVIRDRVGVAPIEEKLTQHRLRWFGHVQRRPPEAPVRSEVLERVDNVKRGRGRHKLMWDESVKRDLKDWNISKEIALDRSAWRLAINVPEP
ncbi:hypothetical protein PVAP13_6NG030383 [Panicum virgatum]|uniref:Uncharacterized protein n=1 Tax=Panicum virgatum TaxID=38727 RepID=A0A8T0QTL2_PANVG|nr:hypothetical protein PVAP13_6NG030383 [Panicum virgatum]